MLQNLDSRTYAAFIGATIIGGGNFIAVSYSNMELPPLFGATLRFGLAALLFFAIARATGLPLARGRAAAGATLYGLLGFGAAYALLYYALLGLSAGTVAVIVAAVPLVTLVIAILLRQERLTLRRLLGSAIVIVGIAVLSLGTLGGDLRGSYLLAALLATVAISASSVVAKAYPAVHPVNMNAIGMAAGTVLLAIGSLALGEPWSLPREASTVMAVGWLVLLGSVSFFQLILYVMKRWAASATVYVVAGMPVVAAALGALLLDQPITTEMLAGGLLVLLAIYVGAISRTKGDRQVLPDRPAGAHPEG